MESDDFGFGSIGKDAAIDLAAFEPKPKPIDRVSADAAAEVAEISGFTRRTPANAERKPRSPAAPAAKAAEKGGKARVNINDLLGIKDRYPETQRAQLNLLAPVPVVLRWRQLVAGANGRPAWEVLEQAMDALEASQSRASTGGRS
ncbi:MAG: hypothetical protein IV099_17065 [Phenylobacterium sp.]|nr:hypothetical protein [Phenylobacterium sp.]